MDVFRSRNGTGNSHLLAVLTELNSMAQEEIPVEKTLPISVTLMQKLCRSLILGERISCEGADAKTRAFLCRCANNPIWLREMFLVVRDLITCDRNLLVRITGF